MQQTAADIARQNLTDLFVFSHGWNNDRTRAREIYDRFFRTSRTVVDATGGVSSDRRIGVVGVLWPSILFPDDEPTAAAGGAASFETPDAPRDPIAELKNVFPDNAATLDRLGRLLEEQPEDIEQLREFQLLLYELAPSSSTDEGSAEGSLLQGNAEHVFDVLSTLAPPGERADAAAFGDRFTKLWSGAKEALRVVSYWNMKERAGHVGERGVGPLVAALHKKTAALRVHLIGHSFGARVVSYALKGLPPEFNQENSPVKSLTLLQRAFSHFAFADRLPHDPTRSGALRSLASRVDGPILVTHSQHDLAVCARYPQASILSRDDAAAFEELRYRFGAMGANGAQGVNASTRPFGPRGHSYPIEKGTFLNLNGDDLITQGQPASGAHSDIFYEEIAWAVLLASGVVAAAQPT